MKNHLQVLRIFPHFHFFFAPSHPLLQCSLEALRNTQERRRKREIRTKCRRTKGIFRFLFLFHSACYLTLPSFLHISFSLFVFSHFSFSLRRTTSLNVNKVLSKQFCAQFHIFTYPRLTPSQNREIHMKSDGDVFCCFFSAHVSSTFVR